MLSRTNTIIRAHRDVSVAWVNRLLYIKNMFSLFSNHALNINSKDNVNWSFIKSRYRIHLTGCYYNSIRSSLTTGNIANHFYIPVWSSLADHWPNVNWNKHWQGSKHGSRVINPLPVSPLITSKWLVYHVSSFN